MRPDGRRMTRRDWDDGLIARDRRLPERRRARQRDAHGEPLRDDSFLMLFNAHFEQVEFRLPARRFATHWELELATGACEFEQLAPGRRPVIDRVAVARRLPPDLSRRSYDGRPPLGANLTPVAKVAEPVHALEWDTPLYRQALTQLDHAL